MIYNLLAFQQESIEGVDQLPLPVSGIRDWELDSLMRIKATEHLVSARITLKV